LILANPILRVRISDAIEQPAVFAQRSEPSDMPKLIPLRLLLKTIFLPISAKAYHRGLNTSFKSGGIGMDGSSSPVAPHHHYTNGMNLKQICQLGRDIMGTTSASSAEGVMWEATIHIRKTQSSIKF
jgi:hypothetical protein